MCPGMMPMISASGLASACQQRLNLNMLAEVAKKTGTFALSFFMIKPVVFKLCERMEINKKCFDSLIKMCQSIHIRFIVTFG